METIDSVFTWVEILWNLNFSGNWDTENIQIYSVSKLSWAAHNNEILVSVSDTLIQLSTTICKRDFQVDMSCGVN